MRAIGGRANRETLDIFEPVLRRASVRRQHGLDGDSAAADETPK